MSDSFESPLRSTRNVTSSRLRFRPTASSAAMTGLRLRMNIELFTLIDSELEGGDRLQAKSILEGYCGGSDDFFRLFYQPVWSFLHWFDNRVSSDAVRAHTLALFLHLWDDHLADGQLAKNALRQRIQQIGWRHFERNTCSFLQQTSGVKPTLFDRHVARYKKSISTPCPKNRLSSYCDHFRKQIATWTLIPYAVGHGEGGKNAGRDLSRIIELFSTAWRLVDDWEDIDEDIVAGSHSSVYLLLDQEGRSAWDSCSVNNAGEKKLDDQSWLQVMQHAGRCGVEDQLAAAIGQNLDDAAACADQNAWTDLADEIRQATPAE